MSPAKEDLSLKAEKRFLFGYRCFLIPQRLIIVFATHTLTVCLWEPII